MEEQWAEADAAPHQARITEKVQFELGSELDLPSSLSRAAHTDPNHLPLQPLQLQATNPQLSRSYQQIFFHTSTKTIRSSSAGAILDLSYEEHSAATATCGGHSTQAPEPPKRRHYSEVHRPLMWQASVDHLTPEALGRKRRCVDGRRFGQPPPQTHLGVKKLLSNLRRSFSDLFNIDDDPQH